MLRRRVSINTRSDDELGLVYKGLRVVQPDGADARQDTGVPSPDYHAFSSEAGTRRVTGLHGTRDPAVLQILV